jgi:tetratricopeptide (TPR) repeat protein
MGKLVIGAAVAVWLLEGLRRFVRRQRTVLAQLAAYRRGDYAEQLRIVEGLRGKRSDPPEYLFFRGKALFEMGDLQAAEDCLRKGLPLEPTGMRKALAEDALGEILLEQGRYDEAIASWESSIAHAPGRGCCHRGIATAILRQGGPAVDAIRWARTAAQIDEKARRVPSEPLDLNLAEALATLAWATAAYSGDVEEVQQLLARSFELCPETTRPIRGQLHYHAGRAYAALGRMEASAGQFAQAAGIDPNGNFGRIARSSRP